MRADRLGGASRGDITVAFRQASQVTWLTGLGISHHRAGGRPRLVTVTPTAEPSPSNAYAPARRPCRQVQGTESQRWWSAWNVVRTPKTAKDSARRDADDHDERPDVVQ